MAHLYNHRTLLSPVVFVDMYSGMVPPNNPIVGGRDVNGEPIYCARAIFDMDLIPGKMVPSHRCCYISHGGKEHPQTAYQVLTNPHNAQLAWVPAHSGNVPTGAIVVGMQSDGQRLYIGRTFHSGSQVVGKVHPEHGTLYFPFGGQELSSKSYEVLVVKEMHAI